MRPSFSALFNTWSVQPGSPALIGTWSVRPRYSALIHTWSVRPRSPALFGKALFAQAPEEICLARCEKQDVQLSCLDVGCPVVFRSSRPMPHLHHFLITIPALASLILMIKMRVAPTQAAMNVSAASIGPILFKTQLLIFQAIPSLRR